MKSGKTIYYYQAYLPDGSLSNGRSTGQLKIGAAKAFCKKLEQEGKLIPKTKNSNLIFETYFADWWEWGPDYKIPAICPYLTRKYKRGQRPSYAQAHISRLRFKKHILPFYKDMYIPEITTKHIEEWLDSLADKKLSGKSQIDILSLLRIMLKEAKRMGDIKNNPILDVLPPSKGKPKKRGILTVEETESLFNMKTINKVWDNDYQAIGAFMLAWDTAMRPGEIRAMQRKHIHFLKNGECRIDIVQAVDHISHQIKETKTGAILEGVTVRSDTAGILRRICTFYNDPDDLIFSKDGISHVSENYLKRRLYKALYTIGISEEDRKTRNITSYSFRNQAITRLRQAGISDFQVRALARHTTQIMTDGYTKFDDSESIKQIRNLYIVNDKKAVGGEI